MDNDQTIAYISDVGAQGLKPLFIAGSCVTTVFLDLAFAAERWLRHTGALERNTTRNEKILSVFAIIFAIAGTAGLILLSVFDTLHHPRLHDGFLLLFMGGYILSAIFVCAEYQRLGIHFRNKRMLRISFWVKLTFIIVEVILAIAFIACNFTGRTQPAAVLEWVVALVFTFWVLSFVVDLVPASRNHRKRYHIANPGQMEMGDSYIATHASRMTNGPTSTYTSTTTTVNGSVNGGSYTTDGHAHGLKPARPITPSQNY
ncbi:hypothetical protein MMC30_004710 [Trapelia coarctata]|nr:hypothetical protein [Trapelia coarctata]